LVFFGFWEAATLQKPANILERCLLQSPQAKHKPWPFNFNTQALFSGFTISTRRYDTTLRMNNQRLPAWASEAVETERITTIFNRSEHGEVISFLLLKLP